MIKNFRIWTGTKFLYNMSDNKETIDLIDFNGRCFVIKCYTSPFYFENCKISQSTGLVDKNGNEIYEGDIIEFNAYKTVFLGEHIRLSKRYLSHSLNEVEKQDFVRLKGIVSWNDFKAKFIISTLDNIQKKMMFEFCDNIDDFEIVGNIYQGEKND